MIVFLTTAPHDYTIKAFLEAQVTALTRRVITMTYGEFLGWRALPVGTYVLADVDRLEQAERLTVNARLDALLAARPGVRVLNHPLRSLGRTALLHALHEAGLNDFRAVGTDDALGGLSYPVFVRHAVEHTGSKTALIDSPEALAAELRALADSGIDLRELLVVEYVDVRNAQQLHEKYSALRVGDALFANDLSVHTHWICKGEETEFSSDEWLARDLLLQRDNPHAAQLMPIFDLAGIEYGRMDYGFSKGRLQVFEINTNPFVQPPDGVQMAFRPSLELRKRHFVDAMRALDVEAKGSPCLASVPGATGPDRVEAPTRARRWLRCALRACNQLHREHELIRLRNRLIRRRPA